MRLALLISLLLCSISWGQGVEIPEPEADAVPSVTYTGPLTDGIERRLDGLFERLDSWGPREQLFDRLYDRIEERNETRFQSVMAAIESMRSEREGILASIREARGEREGLLSQLAETRENLRQTREEVRQARREAMEKWTPLQNAVDRLIALIWKLLLAMVLLAVLVGLGYAIVLALWMKLKSSLVSKIL